MVIVYIVLQSRKTRLRMVQKLKYLAVSKYVEEDNFGFILLIYVFVWQKESVNFQTPRLPHVQNTDKVFKVI